MSVLVFVENNKGSFKKSAYEAVHYGHLVAQELGISCTALVIGENSSCADLGKYGASEVINIKHSGGFDNKAFAELITTTAASKSAQVVVVNHSANGKALLGRLAVRMNAGSVSGVSSVVKKSGANLSVKKPVFSGKAYAEYTISSPSVVVSLMGNAFQPMEVGAAAPVVSMDATAQSSGIEIIETKTVSGTVPLPEAELVVSAGRGMKGPENWGIIDELAGTLGATTACSRPVSDTGWRPHHEHVGQTGIAIRPNLYIAIGISGAIQHLAGVNSSKTIVVINKDPEAPFFKAADYGVCADLFEVVPRLTAALKSYKASN